MRNISIFSVLIICLILFLTACAEDDARPSASQDKMLLTPAPVEAVKESFGPQITPIAPPKESISPFADNEPLVSTCIETDNNGSFVLRMKDVGGNSSIKLIEAGRSYKDDGYFKLVIGFENGQDIEEILSANLVKEDFFYCVDVTGDGYPEIIFPDLGYENSSGLTAPLILKIENNQIVQIPLFTINEGSQNYSVKNSRIIANTITVVSKQTGNEYSFDISPLCELKKVKANELQFVAPSTGVYSCDILCIAENKFGLTWKSFIELWFDINGTGEPYAKIVINVISTAEYKEDHWVITENLQEPLYQ